MMMTVMVMMMMIMNMLILPKIQGARQRMIQQTFVCARVSPSGVAVPSAGPAPPAAAAPNPLSAATAPAAPRQARPPPRPAASASFGCPLPPPPQPSFVSPPRRPRKTVQGPPSPPQLSRLPELRHVRPGDLASPVGPRPKGISNDIEQVWQAATPSECEKGPKNIVFTLD